MTAAEPLPDETELGNEGYRDDLLARRERTWRALDPAGREAWSVWAEVADQVEPIVPDSPDSPMRIDLNAVRWSMDAHGVGLRRQLKVWRLVQLLHDIRWHRERAIRGHCQAHAWGFDAGEGWDPDCRRCRLRLGLDDAAGL